MKRKYAIATEPGLSPKFDWLKKFTDKSDVPPPEIHELHGGIYWFEIDMEAIGDDVGGNILVEMKDAAGATKQEHVLVTCNMPDFETSDEARAEIVLPIRFLGRGR